MVAVDPNYPVLAADIDRLLFYLFVGELLVVVGWVLRSLKVRGDWDRTVLKDR
jgi:hypothetical protein